MDIRPEQAQGTGTDKHTIQQPSVPTAPSPVTALCINTEDC